jgi:protein-disulfide isomerase
LGAGVVLGTQLNGPTVDSHVQYNGPKKTVADWTTWVNGGDRIGPDSAPVVLLEFGDFQCPACRQLALHELRFVREKYPDQLAVVFRHFPMPYHKFAFAASRAAKCAARQHRFDKIYDLLYEKQDSLGKISFDAIAAQSGVADLHSFHACLSDPTVDKAIQADFDRASGQGINSTPSIAINGNMLPMNPDSSELDYQVRKALRAARGRH